jgi:hypothetical protein
MSASLTFCTSFNCPTFDILGDIANNFIPSFSDGLLCMPFSSITLFPLKPESKKGLWHGLSKSIAITPAMRYT